MKTNAISMTPKGESPVQKGGGRVAPPRLDTQADWRSQWRCSLCGMPMPTEDAVLIPERGPLCVGCVGEIEGALAGRRPDNSEH
jgi:hypothetical protein